MVLLTREEMEEKIKKEKFLPETKDLLKILKNSVSDDDRFK